jgi:quinol monooxygenase YgiN
MISHLPKLVRSALLVSALTLVPIGAGGFIEPAATGFKTTHVFTLADEAAEAELRAILAQFNQRIQEAAGSDARYRLWRVQEGEQEAVRFLWESTWRDQASYDAVHADPEFRALLARHSGALLRLLQNHSYSRYSEVHLGEPAPTRSTSTGRLP